VVFDKFRQQLSQLGDLKKMRDQAVALQRQLAAEEVVVEEQGVRVVMTGDQKIKELSIQGISNRVLIDVLNKAIRRVQKIAARKLQEISGGLGELMQR
jgi:DNA-binding protein YbaB